MAKLKFLLLYVTINISSLSATTFWPIPIESQIQESNAVIYAEYIGKSYKKIVNDQIVTELSFKLIKSAGLNKRELINQNSFKVIHSGGVWQDYVYDVSGTPKFKKKERAILLLKRINKGFWIYNLAMGKYNLVKEEDGKYVKSSIYPNHPKLGTIKYSKFNNVVEKKFGQGLEESKINKHVYIKNKSKITKNSSSRKPAAEEFEKLDSQESKINIFWLIFSFVLLGVFSTYMVKIKK